MVRRVAGGRCLDVVPITTTKGVFIGLYGSRETYPARTGENSAKWLPFPFRDTEAKCEEDILKYLEAGY